MATLNRPNALKLDKVLSSQPELGPKIPDGGYGWVILGASLFFQTLIPSIAIALGVFLMVAKVMDDSKEPTLWDNNFVYTPVTFSAIWIILDPFNRRLCRYAANTRYVITAGLCTTCAGLLVLWYAINIGNRRDVFILAGILIGGGASLVMCQIEMQILQYFHLKLPSINTILNIATSVGFIFTPMILGHGILRGGVLETITWYQAFLLIGLLLSLAFRKPRHLKKLPNRRYKLVRGISDDEEDIFAKNSTELQSPRSSIQVNRLVTEAAIEHPKTSSNETPSTPPVAKNELISIDVKYKREGWEKFEDETIESSPKPEPLHRSFSEEFDKDLNKIEKFEDTYVEIPKPLFTENYINNNMSYSYEFPAEINEPVVFEPITRTSIFKDWKVYLEHFKEPTFYKSLAFYINLKFSSFVLWTLFPVYFYIKVDLTNISLVLNIVSCVSLGNLMFALITTCLKTKASTRALFLWIFCWIGTTGFTFISDSKKETSMVFGAVLVTFSTSALQIMGAPLLKLNSRGETTSVHTIISILTGLGFVIFFITDMKYKSCFRFMATLQFLTGSLWFTNFVYKKLKKQMT